MKKKLLILFVSSLICIRTSGQEKFRDAYIVTNEKDTIQGQILGQVDAQLAFEISFKNKASDSQVTSYVVSDLIGFKFNNGRTFERIKSDTTAVFAKKILTGKFDLWVWRNENNEPDIFLKNNINQKFVHLTKVKDRLVSHDGIKYIQNSHRFLGQIKHVTDDEFKPSSRMKSLKYSERNIVDQVLAINQKYETQTPTNRYKEELVFAYDVNVGVFFLPDLKPMEFKVGLFRRKTKIEQSMRYSVIRGITYYGVHDREGYKGSIQKGTSNYRWQLINILPLGLHVQGKQKTIKPYFYTGFGLAVIARSDYKIIDYVNTGSKRTFSFFPAAYAGLGVKFKVRSNYLLAEVTPSIWSSTISVGYSF